MSARLDDRLQNLIISYLSQLQQLVAAKAAVTTDLNKRFTIDVLADVLDKTRVAVPQFFPDLDSDKENFFLDLLTEQYELIHLDHERNVSMLTALKAKAELTSNAINHFYSNISPQKINSHTIVLYNNALYHYNKSGQAHPTLTPIRTGPANNTSKEQNRTETYRRLKAHIAKQSHAEIVFAQGDVRSLTADLIEMSPDYQLRRFNLALTADLLDAIEAQLQEMIQKYTELKNKFVGSVVSGGLIIGGIVGVELILWKLIQVLSGSPVTLAKMIVLLKFTVILGAVLLGLGFGLAFHFSVRYNAYQQLLPVLTQIKFTKTYPEDLSTEHTVSEFRQTFFTKHREVLETPFSSPRLH